MRRTPRQLVGRWRTSRYLAAPLTNLGSNAFAGAWLLQIVMDDVGQWLLCPDARTTNLLAC